jgi:hypothetical protein
MCYVEDRIGVKINTKDRYYDAEAIESYVDKGKRMLKHVKKDEGEDADESNKKKEVVSKVKST